MNQTAIGFLTRCFAHGETIALLLRRDSADGPAQRIVTLEQVLAPRYLRWLAYENGAGANVYVAANPLRSGSRKRTKESVASVRHLYLDIDVDGDTRLAALRASDAVPIPNAILATSPGKYQVLWRVEGFDLNTQEGTLRQLAVVFGGDPACTDCNRVLRLPGFLNCKYFPAPLVAAEYPSDFVSNPTGFNLTVRPPDALLQPGGIAPSFETRKYTDSERDWAWVLQQLADGKDAAKLTLALASRRADKPNPLYYAQRTVDMASARLWLRVGLPIGHVITQLERRRELEIPAALCSARAREIAATAQRMVARKNVA